MKKLTKTQKRVVIAKDALKQLKLGFYEAENLTWVESKWLREQKLLSSSLIADIIKEELQPILLKANPVCQVCARGALLLSMVRKFDNYSSIDLCIGNENEMRNLFGSQQIDKMEAAFELWPQNNERYEPKANAFGEKFRTPGERLIAILKNVIKNNGTFKP